MSSFYVSLSSIDEVKRFVDAATRCACEIDVLSGRYVINAKSIMGLFSLDLSQPVQVEVQGTDEQRESFRRDVAPFEVQPKE